MAKVDESTPDTFADLLEQLGDVPLNRIRMKPAPGTATEDDVISALEAPRKRLCELVDGVLVEKTVGVKESLLGGFLLQIMWNFLEQHNLGLLLGSDGPLRLFPGQVRMPDVSFLSWDRLPNGRLPDKAIADLAPDLAIEVLSESNTKREMQRKLKDYFVSGVRLTWLIQPKNQTAEVYTSPTKRRRVGKNGTLDGADVLPGFRLSLKDLFTRARQYYKIAE